MTTRAATALVTVLLAGIGLTACAGFGGGPGTPNPAQTVTGTGTGTGASRAPVASAEPAKVAQAQRTHEYPGPTPIQTAASGAGSPEIVIEAFATAYINWSYRTIAPTMRALSQISVGQARAETQLAAARTEQDYELRRGGISNAGVVEAIAPLADGSNQYAVVTRERTTATNTSAYQGLPPAWHVALATVTKLSPGQWVLSAWNPEN